ncbi:MAG TPA: diguanylate cyclase [Abditibacteriaceae bacterium]|jgi:diguanylate cyclase (GGDEF)-like protein
MTKVLIAEDDPEINNLTSLTLRMDGYEVLQAHDGRQALQLILQEAPDLVMLDVLMPGMNGYEVAQEMQSRPAVANVPVIFVTAQQDMEDRVHGLGMAVDYICKPFAVPELLARVRSAVRVRKLQEQLEKLAITDELTGLTNRRGFLAHLEEELWRARRFGHPLAVLLFDLDHFKKVNDTWGHAQGDAVLKAFARVLEHSSRRTDKVGRLGGEEFAAVLSETDIEGAGIFAEKVRAATEDLEIHSDGGKIPVTVSAGAVAVPIAPVHNETDMAQSQMAELASRFLQAADHCLYEAKETGRNRTVLRTLGSVDEL